eukprot:6206867-Pleurochrysis_carterae.AAC.3
MAEQTLNPQSQDFRELMTTISNRVCDSQQQRSVFLMCHGDVVLQKLLQQLVFPRDASAKLPHSIVNECVQILVRMPPPDCCFNILLSQSCAPLSWDRSANADGLTKVFRRAWRI